jgi:type II secretory pathway pseudopilin PulG
MSFDVALLASMVAFAALIALPALAAASRKRAMREASDVAGSLSALALAVRRSATCPPLDASLHERARRLRAPELVWLLLAHELPQPNPDLLSDTAQRLALRLKRRVAFERKMLARTASGRRRGAVAASIPPLALVTLHAFGMQLPSAALLFVVAIEACGCWLLWRVARVEI